MQETNKLGKVMDTIFESCNDCPLERICDSDSDCDVVWKEFFDSKVKEDGIEICRK